MKKDFDELVHLSFFTDIGKAIVSARTIKEIMDNVMDKIGTIFTPLNWSLLLSDSSTNELIFEVVVGEAAKKLLGIRIPNDEGITGVIFKTGQPVIVEDVQKDIRFNEKIDKITGFKTESIIGVPIKTDEKIIGVIELVNKFDGKPFTPFELKILSSIADFTAIAIEKVFYVEAIEHLSKTDHLTGVLNRRGFDHILRREIEHSKRYKNPLSVLLIDIDNFKKINDTYGHIKGDLVLKKCAELLIKNTRKVDYIARYGGDEFAVIMPNIRQDNAEIVRKRILDDVNSIINSGFELPFSISIGIQSSESKNIDKIFETADKNLYKEKGKKPKFTIESYLLNFISEEKREKFDK